MAGDVARVEVEAHRQKTVLAGELQRVRALADPGDANRRMGLLEGPDMRPQGVQHQPGMRHMPVFALVIERLLGAPQLQDDVERFACHLAVLAGIAVDIEHRPVARQPARRHPEIEPALGEVVEHRDPVGELGRVMIGQKKAARGEADLLRFHQRLGDQQVGGGMRLPGRGMVLADPGLDKAQLVGPAQGLKIPAVTVEEWALRWVRRHCEQTVLHAFCLPLWSSGLSHY